MGVYLTRDLASAGGGVNVHVSLPNPLGGGTQWLGEDLFLAADSFEELFGSPHGLDLGGGPVEVEFTMERLEDVVTE